jgi:Na+/H+ antiporter NhaC
MDIFTIIVLIVALIAGFILILPWVAIALGASSVEGKDGKTFKIKWWKFLFFIFLLFLWIRGYGLLSPIEGEEWLFIEAAVWGVYTAGIFSIGYLIYRWENPPK